MTVVDHRVLINAPPEVVWELLGNLAAIPKWHTNCTQASIITTQQEGVGVRYRLAMKSGPDLVQEILSWYRNLGYEYTVVDGPFKASRGHIRLQPIYEGTIVQWTLEYELGGFAAGMRDSGTRRRLENEFESSLKRLKKLIEATGIRMDDETRARVTMRPAPSAKERAELAENIARTQPTMKPVEDASPLPDRAPAPTLKRVAPVIDEGDLPPAPQPVVIGDDDIPPTTAEVLTMAEPPLTEEDTRPRPIPTHEAPVDSIETAAPLSAATEPVIAPARKEPDITELVMPVIDQASQPADNVAVAAEPGEQETAHAESQAETLPEPITPIVFSESEAAPEDTNTETEPDLEPLAPEVQTTAETAAVSSSKDPDISTPEETAQLQIAARQKSLFEEDLRPMGPSIWEVFGMAAPEAESASVTPQLEPMPAARPEGEQIELSAPEELLTDRLRRVSAGRRKHHPGLRSLLQHSVMLRHPHDTE